MNGSDTNHQLLRQKNLTTRKCIGFFSKDSRKLNNILIGKSKLYDHFKYLNNALEAPQVSVNMNDDNDDSNVLITEREVRLCMKD